MKQVEEKLRADAVSHGWQYFGVADLTGLHPFMSSICGDFIRKYPRAISLAIALSGAVVDEVEPQEKEKVLSYHNYIYYAVDYLQNTGTVKLARSLENNGWKAYPIPASYSVYSSKMAGMVSHKMTARAAGIGWIGKSGLLVTPRHGPRVRLTTILTNAPLEPGEPIPSQCGKCQVCEEQCPQGAILGKAFDENRPEEMLMNAGECKGFIENRKKEWGLNIERCICGMCVAVCPYGKVRDSQSAPVLTSEP